MMVVAFLDLLGALAVADRGKLLSENQRLAAMLP